MMSRFLNVAVVAAAGLTAASPAAACDPAASVCCQSTPANGLTPRLQVDISAFQFRPAHAVIPIGASVRWTNLDSSEHTATSTAVPPVFDSGFLLLNDVYERLFAVVGPFAYRCDVHTDMLGIVSVRHPGDATGDGATDINDFAALAAHFNTTGPLVAYAAGDFNIDGSVNVSDFAVLAASFNTSASLSSKHAAAAAAAAVPEASTFVLLIVATG
jgi:plastocyanin